MHPVIELLDILKIPPDEAVKALLSAFTPCQPGTLRQAWANRKNYGVPPSTREIWQLFETADFRCRQCSSHHRISLDHINSNSADNRLENLQVLCAECNRAKSERPVTNKDHRLRIYRAMIELWQETKRFPIDAEIKQRSGIKELGGAIYMIRLFEARLFRLRPIRHNIPESIVASEPMA